ncbi:hypothetical protein [Altererythrobacter sp. GH1-8]|uniref:hypothetical protein n=1 Tax=Altererythrobacter sp. GH1-8 TaxID=3349333 RepID=UPI00374D61DC
MNEQSKIAEVPANLGEEIGGPGKAYFDNVVIDNILDALLELSAATWTFQDRLLVLEKVLEKHGINAAEEIEQHVPDDAEIASRAEQRAAMVQRVFGSFVRRPVAGVSTPAGDQA